MMSHHVTERDPRYGHRSDIDLESGSLSRDRSISRWTCGDAKSRKALVERFAQTSSLHGTAYLCSSRKTSLHLKIIYRVFFSICFLLTVYSVISLLLDNYAKESTFVNTINKDIEFGVEEDPDYFHNYPQITICRSPSYRTDYSTSYLKLVEYAMLALGEPFVTLTPEEITMLLIIENKIEFILEKELLNKTIQFKKRLQSLEERFAILKNLDDHFDLKQFIVDHSIRCEDFFISCVIFIFPVDCCSYFEPILTNYGLCFTMNDTVGLDRTSKMLPDVIAFAIDLHTPPQLVGFRVFLSDPGEEHPFFFDEFEEQSVLPGFVTTIKTQLVKMQRTALHTPWTGLSPDCPIWSPSANHSTDRYSKRQCRVHFFMELMKRNCDCESVLHNTGKGQGKSTLPVCGPEVIYKCYNILFFMENMTKCKTPCIVYKYKSEASYVGLGGSNISRVEFMHDSKQYIYHEYQKATLSSLFSQIGGCLGLYLGASIITVLEIVTFVVSWMYYRFIPAKTTSKVRQFQAQ